MFFLTYDYFEIYSNLTPQEIQSRLSKVVEPWHLFPYASDKYFMGQSKGKKFKMTRKIWYRNPSLPVILGEISPDSKGSIIKVSMRLDLITFLLSSTILTLLGVALLDFMSNWLIFFDQTNFEETSKGISGFWAFVFLYLFFLIPYKIEARIAQKMLFIMFEAESKENVIYYNNFAGLSQFQQITILLIMALIVTFLISLIKFFLL